MTQQLQEDWDVLPSVHGVHTAPVSGIGGRYRVLCELGRGAVGVVYLVRDQKFGGEAAMKVLPAFGSNPAVTPERFRAEVELGQAVGHPNVVEVLDSGVTEAGEPFVVTERLHGQTLGECLKRCESIAWDGALRIVKEAARGLSAVHAAGAVHRDVKPDNLFLCDEERHGVSLKVLDFGFATFTESETDPRVFGTLKYIAPEQAVAERVDARADVYALGVVLFRMLTGQLPFDACAERGILTHHLLSTVPPPSWLRDDLPASVDRVVECAVRKHPHNRYACMDELLEDLDRALRGEPVHGSRQLVWPDRFRPETATGREALSLLSARR